MGKGEIARYERFLLFPQCFQKACFPGESKGVIVWEWVKQQLILFTMKDVHSEDPLFSLLTCVYSFGTIKHINPLPDDKF